MKKTIFKFFTLIALMGLLVNFSACSSDDDKDDINDGGTSNLSSQVAGTYKGVLSWNKNGTPLASNATVTIKVTDLGNNKLRVESASNDYKFTTKEFGIMEAGGSYISKTSDFSGALIYRPNTNPKELTYAFDSVGELVSFSGVKQ